jgi:D-xylose transport system ATP-binding protein
MSAAAPHAEAAPAKPVLSVRGATKRFGSVLALDGVDLEVRRGEILALLGDNGAGKSTLIKCISGLHHLDSGSIHLDGLETEIRSPADARFAGVETVYQDLALFDNLTPAQNFFAGREIAGPAWLPRGLRFLKKRTMDAEARQVISRLKVTLPKLDVVVAKMSGGQRQAIAVARSTVFARKVVILDEPTTLRDQGNAVILITHNMEHVVELADRAMVLRQGRKVGELTPNSNNKQDLVAMIVGA